MGWKPIVSGAIDSSLLARFTLAVDKAFPDAEIDVDAEELTCFYGQEIGFRAYNDEDEGFIVEVNYTFPVVKEEDLPNVWYYFKMEFTSEQLDRAAKNILLRSGHGWQEFNTINEGCPVDWGGFSLTLEKNTSDEDIEQIVIDLEQYIEEARKEVDPERTAQAWFVAKCEQMGLKSSYDLPMLLVPLEEKDSNLVGIGEGMIASGKIELLPKRFISQTWSRLTIDKLAIGDRFYFAESKGHYFAYNDYLFSFARRVLSLAVEPMEDISKTYGLIYEINQGGQLRIQLKSLGGFNPWFLINPCDLFEARALEPKEPTISQRAGLLRSVLGESKVLSIDFNAMSDDEFEDFCCNLLVAQGASEVVRRGPSRSRDSGVDISCKFEQPILFGKQTISVLVQCKRIKKSFGKTEYNMLNYRELLKLNNADQFIVMCASEITKDVLDLAYASEGKLRVMGHLRLIEEAAKYPELFLRVRET